MPNEDKDESSIETTGRERRSKQRFPLQQQVYYRLLDGKSSKGEQRGRTINMSSSGVLFETPTVPSIGERVEMKINWPGAFASSPSLALVVRGEVVRTEKGRAAIAVAGYAFEKADSIASMPDKGK